MECLHKKKCVLEKAFPPHLIASVRLCGVLKVRVWATWAIAGRQMIHN